jgi:hypothetical protein
MYEGRRKKILSRRAFARRVARHLLLALVLITLALAIGVIGYRCLEGLDWLDSLLNASMILGGMGPVDKLVHPAAKFFASLYALFAGLVFIGVASVVVAPFAHRLLHTFHAQEN